MPAEQTSRKEPASSSAASDLSQTASTPKNKAKTIKLKNTQSKASASAVASTSAATNSPLKSDAMAAAAPKANGNTDAAQNKADGEQPAEEPTTKRCKHCKKYVDAVGHSAHSKACLKAKQERQRQKDAKDKEEKEAKEKAAAAAAVASAAAEASSTTKASSDTPTTTTTAAAAAAVDEAAASTSTPLDTTTKKSTKKRKADDATSTPDAKPAPKKQKKADAAAAAKPKAAKPKGPVDVEKQCGVLLPNGAMCARSLTCKSHAMGAKRAVPGRSLPYDVLLAQYQKKNQAKQQKAALASNAPLPDDLDAAAGPVDSDEERDAVMSGIARAQPRPIGERVVVSVAARTRFVRLKDVVTNALGGTRGASLFSTAAAPVRGLFAPGGGRGSVSAQSAAAASAAAAAAAESAVPDTPVSATAGPGEGSAGLAEGEIPVGLLAQG